MAHPQTASLSAAEGWCCKHHDCGGVTLQNGRYEVRAGSNPIPNPQPATVADSWLKPGKRAGLNGVNLTKCVTTAELDFTQDTSTKYLEEPTTAKTLSLSEVLLKKYAKFF